MTTKIRLRRDVSSNWTSVNPVLLLGEPGFETNTRLLKIGDGASNWTSLNYISGNATFDGSLYNLKLANITHANATVLTALGSSAIRGDTHNYTSGSATNQQYIGFYSTSNTTEPTQVRMGRACITANGLIDRSTYLNATPVSVIMGSDKPTSNTTARVIASSNTGGSITISSSGGDGFTTSSSLLAQSSSTPPGGNITGNSSFALLAVSNSNSSSAHLALTSNGSYAQLDLILSNLSAGDGNLIMLYNANSILTRGYADVRYQSANSVSAFNTRTGNITLTANDITTLVDANYIQVWKDTQANAGTLTQFPKYSSISSGSGPIQGYSRGLLTSNTSGTVTKTIFDGSLYSTSGSTVLQYKAIGFNANDTGAANTSKTGRLLVGQYGEVYLESSTKVNANTFTTATFDVLATQRPSGLTQIYDPHSISGGIHARYAIGATGGYDPNSSADRVSGGKIAEFDLYSISQIVRYNNGTYIGRPAQVYLTATNDLTAVDPSLEFDHAYDYKTTLSLGESAELVFQNANRTLFRTPNMTDYSILTRGYADTRYMSGTVGVVLLDNNISQSVTGNGTFGIISTSGDQQVATNWDYSQGIQLHYSNATFLSSIYMYSNSTSIVVENGNTGQNINVSLTSTSAEIFCNGNYTQTGDSLLTRSMMDTRYQQKPNVTFTGNFTSQDGRVVNVANGIITSVV